MNFKKVGTKMMAIILPVIIISMVVLMIISATTSSSLLMEQIDERMNAELSGNENSIVGAFNQEKAKAAGIASSVAATYKGTSISEYEEVLCNVMETDSMAYGSGLWFEPNVFDASQKYVGPYAYLEGSDAVITYDYSNADYDYFAQDYYTLAKASTVPIVTDPFYDETSGIMMASVSAPILEDGKFIGCVSIDLGLEDIQEVVESVKVGKEGSALLLSSDGTFISGVDDSKISSGEKITQESESSFASAGQTIMSSSSGEVEYNRDGVKYKANFMTIPDLNWKFIIQIPKSELQEPVIELVIKLIIVVVIAVIIAIIIIVKGMQSVTKPIAVINDTLSKLADGRFTTVDKYTDRQDEIGQMINNSNSVMEKLRKIVGDIKEATMTVGTQSQALADTANQISQTADDVSSAVQDIAKGATEQANAIEGANTNVGDMAEAIQNVAENAVNLATTAANMEDGSMKSSDALKKLTDDLDSMERSIADISETMKKTNSAVEIVNEKVEGITSIASQTNLLALNASIEAARAGEAGKGFAVVAEEIGKLASDSAITANEIKEEMNNLLHSASDAIEKTNEITEVKNQVTERLQDTVKTIQELINDVSSTVDGVNNISGLSQESAASKVLIADSMQSLSAISEENAASTEETSASMQELNATVNVLAGSAGSLSDIAKQLEESIAFFKDEEE